MVADAGDAVEGDADEEDHGEGEVEPGADGGGAAPVAGEADEVDPGDAGDEDGDEGEACDADEVGDLNEGGVAMEGDAEAIPTEAGEDPAAEPLGGDPGGGGEGGAAEGLEGAGCGGGLAEGGDAGAGVAGDEPGPEAEVTGEDAGEAEDGTGAEEFGAPTGPLVIDGAVDDAGGVADPGDVGDEEGEAGEVAGEEGAAERWGVWVEGPEDGEEGEEPDPGEDFEVGAGEGEVQEEAAEEGRGEVAEGGQAGQEARHAGGSGEEFGVEFVQCPLHAFEIFGIGQDGEIGIPAKLRSAVEHASLAAHQQGANFAALENRKDFVNRVRDQGCLLGPNTEPIVWWFRASAPVA